MDESDMDCPELLNQGHQVVTMAEQVMTEARAEQDRERRDMLTGMVRLLRGYWALLRYHYYQGDCDDTLGGFPDFPTPAGLPD